MPSFSALKRPEILLSITLVAALAGTTFVGRTATAVSDACPPGTAQESMTHAEVAAQLPPELRTARIGEFPDAAGKLCRPIGGLETAQELALREIQQRAIFTAPFSEVPEGARSAAVAQREAMLANPNDVWGANGTWEKYGVGPLDFANERYPDSSGSGIQSATGRIDDYKYDAATDRLFTAIGTSGIWMSEDKGYTWRPISDSLPTQTVSAVAYSSAGGPLGTLIAVTGEHTFGGGSYLGLGVWYTRDLGVTWARSAGPFDGTFGFAAEADPLDPNIFYAATGKGLWRSIDGGVTFTDVELPVGTCAADYDIRTCNFAHFVTDVIVKAPGGVGAASESTAVMAVVGWRAGTFKNPDGSVQSERNGIYVSESGEQNTFEFKPGLSDVVQQDRMGRVEFGPAIGPEQDHNYVYAIVQDAVLLSGGGDVGLPGDVGLGNPTVLRGVYVTPDYGDTWTLLADNDELSKVCAVNESVYCIPGLIEPGAQSWYNQWIAPDPTLQDPTGVPTRLVFGLEEIWATRESVTPKNTRGTSFEVIGAYYGSVDCLLVATNCAANGVRGVTTTHPDQHAGMFLVDEEGTPELIVGHDGGFSRQKPNLLGEFAQDNWTLEQFNGLQTLLPYSAAIANDGVAYAGLQDNGAMKVEPDFQFHQTEVYGADGVLALVDPDNSLYAWESTQVAGFNHTIDGGLTWVSARPPADNMLFVTPGAMDPLDPKHIVTGGTQINETTLGAGTTSNNWSTVFDMGTAPVAEGTPPPRQLTAVDVYDQAIYVGFCGVCDILNKTAPFQNGIATNIGSPDLPDSDTAAGWHIIDNDGSLPNRYITDVTIDPYDATQRTIYVTLGAYSRSWVPPNSVADQNTNVGVGHVYKSTDGGQSFTDISGDLPDTPALTVTVRGDQLLLGTDIGAFISSDKNGGGWAVMGGDQFSPTVITDIDVKTDDPNFILVSSYGRGLQKYRLPDPQRTTTRLEGPTRSATAVQVSKDAFDSAGTVVIAREDVYADGLAGAPLAFKLDAPLLLTRTESLESHVAAEVTRLGATTAVILGGPNAVSAQVEADLRAAGVATITRYGGENRFATAAQIAAQVDDPRVFVVKGNDADPNRGWEDALAVAPVAAYQGRPILLTETGRLPEETIAALGTLGAVSATIVGGPNAVSPAVEAELDTFVGVGGRIAGSNRYATSVAVLRQAQQRGLTIENLYLARGTAFPDALSAGPSVAATGGILLTVDSENLDNSTASRDLLARDICAVSEVNILGGPKAISPFVAEQVDRMFATCQAVVPATPPAPAPVAGPQPPPPPPRVDLAGPFGWESDAEGWTVSIGGNPSTSWNRSGPGFESDTSYNLGSYGDLANTTLTSPVFTGTGKPSYAVWKNRYYVEGGGFDEVTVQWRAGTGDWTNLGVYGGQNTGFPEWSDNEVSFTAPAGDFQVRFVFDADEICSGTPSAPGVCAEPAGYDGFFLDDFKVQADT